MTQAASNIAKLGTCHTCYYLTAPGCAELSIRKNRPDQGCPCWMKPPAAAPAGKVPILKTNDPAEVTTTFKKHFEQAQGALKVVIAFGIFAAHVKYNLLKHGQFGDWVRANMSEEAYRSIRAYMQLAEGVLQKCGARSLKAAVSNWQPLPICHRGEFLLAEESAVPEPVRKLRSKVLDTIKNKTQLQLFLEFKQAEEDQQTQTLKPKRGNLSGKGNPKAQRETAQQAQENARLEALDLRASETAEWLLQVADDKHLGLISEMTRDQLLKSLDTAAGYLRRLAKKQTH